MTLPESADRKIFTAIRSGLDDQRGCGSWAYLHTDDIEAQAVCRLPSGSCAAAGPEPVTLRLVCGWCGAVIREGSRPTSHGICVACRDDVEKGI